MELRRLVEVFSPDESGNNGERGTGYLLNSNCIITAFHTIEKNYKDRSSEIRVFDENRVNSWITADCIWKNEEFDIALLKSSRSEFQTDIELVKFGKLSSNELTFLKGKGFPEAIMKEDNSTEILIIGGKCTDKIIFKNELPVPLKRENWKGISGTALFAEDLLVGIVTEVPKNFGVDTLKGTVITSALKDDEFIKVCREYGVDTALIEISNNTSNRIVHNVNLAAKSFTGRVEYLAQISTDLQKNKKIVLWGNGGLGKTQITLKYLEDNRHKYNSIIFLNANTIEKDVFDFSLKLDKSLKPDEQEKAFAIFRDYIENTKDKTLLAIDNVDTNGQKKEVIDKYITNNVSIIITSRISSWNLEKIEIKEFDDFEAVNFIRERIDKEDGDIGDLAKLLRYYPLALEYASAFIKENEITCKEYMEYYDEEKESLLIDAGDDIASNYHTTIDKTFSLTINNLKNKGCIELLNIFSYLAPEDIPIEILTGLIDVLPEDSQLAKSLKKKISTTKLLTDLVNYSLIKRENDSISLHGILQDVIRMNLERENEVSWSQYALDWIKNEFNYDYNDNKMLNLANKLIVHVTKLTLTVKYYSLQRIFLTNNLAIIHICRAQYKNAEKYQLFAIEMIENLYSLQQLEQDSYYNYLADAYNNLGCINRYKGEYYKAEQNIQKATELKEKMFEVDQQGLASCLNILSMIYESKGEHNKAEEYQFKAIEMSKKYLESGSIEFANNYINLAVIYMGKGDYKEAERYGLKALAMYSEVPESNHPEEHAQVYNNLASIYISLKEYKNAKVFQLKAIRIIERVLEPEHPYFATAYGNFAEICRSEGELLEAEDYHKRQIKIYEKKLERNHPYLTRSYYNLYLTYQAIGNLDKAEMYKIKAIKNNSINFVKNKILPIINKESNLREE